MVSLIPIIGSWLLPLLTNILTCLIDVMTFIIAFFEKLPFAKLSDLNISLTSVFLLSVLIFTMKLYIENRKARMLIFSLSIILALLIIPLPGKMILKEDRLCIYNLREGAKIEWNKGHKNYTFISDEKTSYKIIGFNGKRLLSLSQNKWNGMGSQSKYRIDYLHLTSGNISLVSLNRIFDIRTVILSASLSGKELNALIKECTDLDIEYYDIRTAGAFYMQ
jgi:competence protein ComEC